jgi:hypothetical protein
MTIKGLITIGPACNFCQFACKIPATISIDIPVTASLYTYSYSILGIYSYLSAIILTTVVFYYFNYVL